MLAILPGSLSDNGTPSSYVAFMDADCYSLMEMLTDSIQ